jgi:hypothetical protein
MTGEVFLPSAAPDTPPTSAPTLAISASWDAFCCGRHVNHRRRTASDTFSLKDGVTGVDTPFRWH